MAGDIGIGRLIERGAVRDATHIAVIPVLAGERLKPGEKVYLEGSKVFSLFKEKEEAYIGVVDPFLKEEVAPGEKFYLFLIPGSIKSLRHTWSHKAISSEKLHSESSDLEEWANAKITSFAESIHSSLEEVIEKAEDFLDFGTFWSEGGRFDGQSLPKDFWEAFEVVTGRLVKREDRDSFFSCSC